MCIFSILISILYGNYYLFPINYYLFPPPQSQSLPALAHTANPQSDRFQDKKTFNPQNFLVNYYLMPHYNSKSNLIQIVFDREVFITGDSGKEE